MQSYDQAILDDFCFFPTKVNHVISLTNSECYDMRLSSSHHNSTSSGGLGELNKDIWLCY